MSIHIANVYSSWEGREDGSPNFPCRSFQNGRPELNAFIKQMLRKHIAVAHDLFLEARKKF